MACKRTIRATISLGLAIIVLISASVLSATPAAAGPIEDEQRFLQLVNQTRAAQGLAPLAVHGELTAEARSWSSSMAAGDRLAHTPDMTRGITANWTVLGENVGVHGVGDVDQLFQAFVASPSHYQNLVDPRFQYVGIGVVHTSTGKLWTTHRFMAAEASPPTAPTPTTTPTTAAPTTRRTAPPTTPPPTTAPATTSRASSTTGPPADGAPTTTGPSSTPPGADPAGSDPADPGPATPSTTSTTGPGDPPPSGDAMTDPSELIQPDAATIEDVLIDLVAAGI